jgi:type VI secretion system secreted protein VgrG
LLAARLQRWAGARYGGIAIPRVGMEVLVTFLEGDPDQPLISGCLYHKENPSRTTAGEQNPHRVQDPQLHGRWRFNELRIEDKKGAGTNLPARPARLGRKHRARPENPRRQRTPRHRRAEHLHEFKAEEHHTVHADRKVEARANDHLTVA